MSKNGVLIGYHIDRDKIVNSEGRLFNSKDSWLPILLEDNQMAAKIFYDLDYSVACLLFHEGVTQEQGAKLLKTHKLNLPTGYRLGYFAGRMFTIDYGYGAGHGYTYFYNARQYKDVHHQRKEDVGYAIGKAKEAAVVGNEILTAYEKIGITHPSLTSPVKAFVKSGLYPQILTVEHIPQEAGEFAYQAIRGNWVECYQLGFFPEVFDYDINGAYAAELSNLMDLRNGKWIKHTGMTGDLDRVPYGIVRGRLDVTAPFNPFVYNSGEKSSTPTGSREEVLTLQAIDFLRRNRLGSFKPEVGWYWVKNPNKAPQYPFRPSIKRLWNLRDGAGDTLNKVIKRILAGMWGVTLQIKGTAEDAEFGEMFNPVYGAIVETNCRLKVAQACLDNGITPLAVAVDGVITDKSLKVDLGNGLGQWRLSHHGKGIILSSGVVGVEGKDASEDFAVTYAWLMEALTKEPSKTEYSMRRLSPVTLARALGSDGWNKLGELVDTERAVHIGGDTKRLYPVEPVTGADILKGTYPSEPWDISIVGTR